MAEYLSVKHAIGVNSGTDALVIALRALGIGDGDEVITTPFSFFATAECVNHCGGRPVFVDIEPDTFNLDVERLDAAITARTKAILPAHMFGHAVDMERLMALAARHGLKVVEDVAQALGADDRGAKLAAVGDVGCISFFPSKPLGAFGDGGMVVTNDDETADSIRMLRAHGARKKYYNEVLGYNSRLDELQAAILRVKLPHLDDWNAGRRVIADRYTEAFAGFPGVAPPVERPGAMHVYHQYTIRIADGKRDAVQAQLAQMGIGTMVYYPVAIHQLPFYAGQYPAMREAESAAGEVLSLPIWPEMAEETQETVIAAVLKASQS
jgi:dTDP-4-amino-4,6-dideoxygalactose transaminase